MAHPVDNLRSGC
ncbi:hypothetical protein STIAU_3182, partial [Stigmatella aurantiaca DW4/3-1]